MGTGRFGGGRFQPITPRDGKAWTDVANNPIPQSVKDHHANQHAATHTQRLTLPGPVDIRGNPLPARPKAPGSWL